MMSPADKRRIEVNGLSMSFHDIGSGDPIVFLHGNPTSSYLWRKIIPHVESFGRCIAPDLIGMGDSEKLPNSNADSYTFVENRRYLDGFFAALGLERRVTLVVHDWGSALGFDWAKRNPHAVKGIVHMEAIVATMSWQDIPAPAQPRFRSGQSLSPSNSGPGE
jgi:haloalkane dehalogenase